MTEVMELFEIHLRDTGEGRVPIRRDDNRTIWRKRNKYGRSSVSDDEQRKRDSELEGK